MKKEPYILVVDDTPEHIQTAGTILKSHGYSVRVATNGKKALEIITQEPPAIVLLDIRMKEMDGFSVCQTLRQSTEYQDISIIFVTADHDRFNLQKGFELGAQDYILKPYHPSELIARINTQMKMHQQADELRAAYADLGQFCHNVSHDLKAPVHFISSLANEIKSELMQTNLPMTSSLPSMLEQLTNRCEQTIHMVEHLLKFAELSEASVHFEAIALSPFIQKIADDLIALHPHREIRLNCPPNLPVIQGDPRLLTHLFQNIIGNSIKFTRPRKTARLSLTAREDDLFYHITLQDNGIGISSSHTERLFYVFERASSEYEGSGVGLAIVKRIIIMHGGHVSLSGHPQKGAAICVSFPKV